VTVAFDAFLGAAGDRRPRPGRWWALAGAAVLHAGALGALYVRHAPTHATRPVLSVPVVFRPARLALPAPALAKHEPAPPAPISAPAPRPRSARRAPAALRREPRPAQEAKPATTQSPAPPDTRLTQPTPATPPPVAGPAAGSAGTPAPGPASAAVAAATTPASAAGSGAAGGTGARPARFLPEALANLQKLSGAAPEFPASLAQAGAVHVVQARICVAPAGHVESVTLLKGAHPVLDGNVRRAVMTWRYRPLLAGGAAIPFCTLARFEFKAL
jgi:outer membrane biosynthesis protein TonB